MGERDLQQGAQQVSTGEEALSHCDEVMVSYSLRLIFFESLLKCKCQAFLFLFFYQLSSSQTFFFQLRTPERDDFSLKSSWISVLQCSTSVSFMSHCSRFFSRESTLSLLCENLITASFKAFISIKGLHAPVWVNEIELIKLSQVTPAPLDKRNSLSLSVKLEKLKFWSWPCGNNVLFLWNGNSYWKRWPSNV